jgi:hypothetical protein
MRTLYVILLLSWSSPVEAGKPFVLFRPQAVLGHGEALRIEEVGHYLREALGEVGDYDVIMVDPDRSERAYTKTSKVERLAKRWRSEIDFAETNLRRNKPGMALKGAALVWRRLSKSPALVQDAEILCRTYLIYAEASLQLGKKQKAEQWVRRLAGSCTSTYRSGRWRAKSSKAFVEFMRKIKAVMKHVAPAQITIVTEQAGAEVFVDARLVGLTPLHLTGVPPGQHVLRVEEQDRMPWSEWVELTAVPRTLRLQGQADWLHPAEVELQQALRDNQIDDRVIKGAKALLARLEPLAPYLAIIGVLEEESSVRLRLILVDTRGRILRVPELVVDDSFLGLEAELQALFAGMSKGKLRWTGLNKGPIFPSLEEAHAKAPETRFAALVETGAAVDGEGRDEDKDEELQEEDPHEDKDRLRPILRGKNKRKPIKKSRRIKRRKRGYSDFKDDDDK